MPKAAVNFSQIPVIEPVPTGPYHLRIMEVKEKASDKGDFTNWNVKFKIQTGEYEGRILFETFTQKKHDAYKKDGEPDPLVGQPFSIYQQLAVQKALGLGDDVTEVDTDNWIGGELIGNVEKFYNDYSKKDDNRINSYGPLP